MTTIINNKHYFYLLLSLVGGGLTFYFVLLGIIEHDGNFNTIAFIKSTWIENYYAKSLTMDFWTGTVAGTFFMLAEGIRLKMKRIWVYLFVTVFIAFTFGFPLFLFMRAQQMKKKN